MVSQSKPPTVNSAATNPSLSQQVQPPPGAQGGQTVSPTTATQGTATYIPIPIPTLPAAHPSGLALIGILILLGALAFVLRVLWRLPEMFADRDLVQNLGGPYNIQNRVLHALGYVSFVAGVFTNNFLAGLIAAALMMIAANVRPTGNGSQ